ncbi:serine/threonine-protein kinase BLUS1-like protein isoform X2 [Cinnamomum micranthum f. kanehirae]|uniref:Serine/threonine-protein kinase BLUS1-like protein isoform X2 n=1 Tax=Cinnamomum micranthum f. kanehirae TaxID=337451 RepID=A0A3S3Q7J4_9MAGN|nr:serine/threonine-protein kinase BLUS1-like protein isoform X2 [Cinnamomum micranthum f. kanehirae]
MGRMGTARRSYSASAADYKLLEEVGYGASATVYRAIYLPTNEIIAVKCLDLDRCSSNLDDIQREAQTMSLIDHPNVIRAFCSFVVERCLWVVMPFMAEGSCLHLMKIAYPDGFEESVIGSILKETLKALEYLHRHGHIHRDVKAGNILLDSGGVVKLGDFGVSACMFDRGDRQRSRTTFVGTPCWMAPEVLQPGSGYDFKADIWSFGITALELAHGHAPFSKYPPMKVLLMTIQNAPPGLDYDRDKRFSKSFKEMVAMCLVKDQTKRPTAEKLLKHSFFKNAKPPELSVKNLLTDLPPLWDRVKALQLKDAAQLALKKMPSAEQEALSLSEYKRGVSAWNFDIEDLKAQASLVQDGDDLIEMKDDDENLRLLVSDEDSFVSPANLGKSMSTSDVSFRGNRNCSEWLDDRCKIAVGEILETDLLNSSKRENSDKHEKDGSVNNPTASSSDKDMGHNCCTNQVGKTRQTQSGPLVPASVLNHSSERERNAERREGDSQPATEKFRRDVRKAPSFSGPLMLSNRASLNSLSAPIRSSGGYRDSLEEKSKANVVQIKGRFSVTSENVDLVKDIPLSSVSRRSSQVSPLRKSASVGDWQPDSRQLPNSKPPKEVSNSAIPASVLIPHLQNLLQQTALQQDLIMTLLNNFQQAEAVDAFQTGTLQARNLENDMSTEAAASERERLLLTKITELQARMINLTDELTAAKLKHIQLQQQLCAAYGQEEDGSRRGEKDS